MNIQVIDTFNQIKEYKVNNPVFSIDAYKIYTKGISPSLYKKCCDDAAEYNFERDFMPVQNQNGWLDFCIDNAKIIKNEYLKCLTKSEERARENLAGLPNVTLICGDFLTHAFGSAFDVVYSSLTFMHIENKQRAVNKAADLLQSGGRFVLSIDKNQSKTIDTGSRRVRIFPDDPEGTGKMLKAAGLTVVERYETEFAVVFVASKQTRSLSAPNIGKLKIAF